MHGEEMMKETIGGGHNKWGWFMALGLILIALGIIAVLYPVVASVAATIAIGIIVAAAGIVQIIHALSVRGWGQSLLWLLAGLIYTGAGVMCLIMPLSSTMALTLLLAAFFIVAGIIRIIIGFRVHNVNGAAWVIINGIVTALLGIIIIFQWPFSGLWTFGLLIGIDLLFQGIGWIAFSCGLKQLSR